MLLAAGVARVFHPGGALEDIARVHPRHHPVAPRAARCRLGVGYETIHRVSGDAIERIVTYRTPNGRELAAMVKIREPRMNKPLDKPLLEPAAGEERWQREYAAQIGADMAVRNRSGIAIKPLYTPRDWNGARYEDDVGYPGQPPYTRGIYPTMHRGRTWTQRQLIGLGTPPDYNARLSAIIAQGASAVSLIPCNSVYRGYDMDEVHEELLGTCGVVVNTVAAHGRLPRGRRPRARRPAR